MATKQATNELTTALDWFKKERTAIRKSTNEDDELIDEYTKVANKCESLDDENGLDDDFDLEDIIPDHLMEDIEPGDDMQEFIINRLNDPDPNDTNPFITNLAWLRAGARAQYEDVLYGVDLCNPNDLEEIDPNDLADAVTVIIKKLRSYVSKARQQD